jgi:hypothetical protein
VGKIASKIKRRESHAGTLAAVSRKVNAQNPKHAVGSARIMFAL